MPRFNNSQFSKLILISLSLFFSYIIFYNVDNEVDFQRYPNIFISFIELYLNGHLSIDYIPWAPIFTPPMNVDSDLPNMVQRLLAAESYYPHFIVLFSILQQVTNLSPQLLITLPIGILFVPIAYLSLIKVYITSNNTNSDFILKSLLFTYFVFYLGSTKFYGSFYVAPPAFLLIIIIFICIKKIYENASPELHFIFLISIYTLTQYWHTALMTALFFIIALFLVSSGAYLGQKRSVLAISEELNQIFKKSQNITLVSLIISLTFIHLWRSKYIEKFLFEASIWDFLSKAILKFQGKVAFPIPYVFNYKESFFGELYFKSVILIYFLAFIIFIIPFILNLHNLRISRKASLSLIMATSILLAQLISVFAYYNTGSINFIYVPLFFPLFGVYLFSSLNFKSVNIKRFMRNGLVFSLICLILLSVISYITLGLTNEAGATSITKYENTQNSFEWVYDHIDPNSGIILDFNILGKYLQRESQISKPKINYMDLNTSVYKVLIGDSNSNKLKGSYFSLDHATMLAGLPIHVKQSRALLVPKLEEINNCSSQNKIYIDSHISIFLFR